MNKAGQRQSGTAGRSQPRWGHVFVLIAYLLFAPPVLLFGPLAGLLLLTRPATAREWLWLIGTGAWSLLWLNQTGGLATQFGRAGAVLLTGTFLALTVWRPSAQFSRALAATIIAAVALLLWMWHLDVGWAELQRAVEHNLWASNREFLRRLSQAAPGRTGAEGLGDEMSAMVRTVGSFYPALLALASLGGLRLAWSWYHRIARRPVGLPPAPFSAFHFNDQLVWGWVLGLLLSVLPLPPAWGLAGANLLLVWAVLYAARGLAIFFAGSSRVPGAVMATIVVVAMFLLPFVLGGLTLLGLSDTWLDFRRRLATPAT